MLAPQKIVCAYLLGFLSLWGETPKEEINRLCISVKTGQDYVSLAKAYLHDQNIQKAIEKFLQALEMQSSEKVGSSKLPDQYLYEEGLSIYLTNNVENACQISQEIIERYKESVHTHADYYQLNYLLASSFANLGKMEIFFDSFFHSYSHLPNHYLAYKTKAILHIKLLELSVDEEYREEQRKNICGNFAKASELCSQDVSLYKLRILYAPEKEKKQIVRSVLQKILEENIIISRTDALFYLESALVVKEQTLANEFLQRAKSWYPNHRGLARISHRCSSKDEQDDVIDCSNLQRSCEKSEPTRISEKFSERSDALTTKHKER